jgi:hypothetical protein
MLATLQLNALAQKISIVTPILDERQRRLYLGSEAKVLGRGGIAAVAQAAGVSRDVVPRRLRELSGEELASAD